MKTSTVMLNDKTIEAVVFGDGQQQIDLFNAIAAHVQEHKLVFETAQLTPAIKGMQKTLIVGKNDKYDIRVTETKIPGIKPPFHYPSYASFVVDNETGKTRMDYGTISHCFWDLLYELKGKQK